MPPATEVTLDSLLDFVNQARGFDFTGYKRSSIQRRVARHGAYTPRQIEDVPREALERFFERTEQRYVFRKELRRSVIFGRNDLVQDAPISRIDLLMCRNTLMYFTAETQSQILRRLHFALDNDGVLVLGKAEMLITHSDLFTPVDLKRRVFRKMV